MAVVSLTCAVSVNLLYEFGQRGMDTTLISEGQEGRAFNMYGDVAAPNLYAVAQQNCLQEPATRRTVMGQRSGSSSSNDDVERAGPGGAWGHWSVARVLRHCPGAAHPQQHAEPPCLPTNIHAREALPVSTSQRPLSGLSEGSQGSDLTRRYSIAEVLWVEAVQPSLGRFALRIHEKADLATRGLR
jgi:hypothetical protein